MKGALPLRNLRCIGPEDLSKCREALSRLHQLGIRHGDVNKHNFLIREGRAILIDFECASKCENPEVLEKELESLEEQLRNVSGRGGVLSVEEPTGSVAV